MRFLLLPIVILSLFQLSIIQIHGFPAFLNEIPNGYAFNRTNSGITCQYLGHEDCLPGTPRNQFGLDFAAAGFKWTTALCETDSDGDGLTNGQELGDNCCQWAPNQTVELRLTDLSHPGVANETNTGSTSCDLQLLPSPSNTAAASSTSDPSVTSVPTVVPSLSSTALPSENAVSPSVSAIPSDDDISNVSPLPSATSFPDASAPASEPSPSTGESVPSPALSPLPSVSALPTASSTSDEILPSPSTASDPSAIALPSITSQPSASASGEESEEDDEVAESPDVILPPPVQTPRGTAFPLPSETPPTQTTDDEDGAVSVDPESSPITVESILPSTSLSPSPVDGSSPEPVATEEQVDSTDDGDDDVCFPGNAQVTMSDGTSKYMKDVQIGDYVLSSLNPQIYSQVYLLTHNDKNFYKSHQYLNIIFNNGVGKISLTRNHFIYVNNKLMQAKHVQINDSLLHFNSNNEKYEVVKVNQLYYSNDNLGLFNPHTLHGDIVVNNIQTSTYTASIQSQMAHSLLMPIRALFNFLQVSTKSFEHVPSSCPSLMVFLHKLRSFEFQQNQFLSAQQSMSSF